MKRTFKYILGVALLAAGATACDVSDTRETYTPETDGVSFVQSVITATALGPEVTTYSVDLARAKADNELTVGLTCAIYNNADTGQTNNLVDELGVPSSVTFAPGKYQAEITFNVGQLEIGESYSGTFSITEGQTCYDPNTAITSVTVNLAKDYNWEDLGEGQWFDQFLLMADNPNIQTVEIRKAEGYGIYRFYNPFPSATVNDAWGSDMAAASATSVPEYIEFSVDETGHVSWGNSTFSVSGVQTPAVNTGYNYAQYGGLYYFLPGPLGLEGDSDNTMLENGTLVQFCWAPYCPEEGVWWGQTTLGYLALPDFAGDLGTYLGF